MLAGAEKLAHADQPQDSHCLLKPADKKADVVGVSLSGSEGGGASKLLLRLNNHMHHGTGLFL